MPRSRGRLATHVTAAVLVLLLTATGCSVDDSEPTPIPPAYVPDWRTDPSEPYPFSDPVPPFERTAVDGIFRRRQPTDTYAGERPRCRRCPEYPRDAGLSWLTLANGRFTVLHERPAFIAIGHYLVDGDRITLFNDPSCSDAHGVYRWRLGDAGELILEVDADDCAAGQRHRDLTAVPWHPVDPASAGCKPPNVEAMVSGHWLPGPACRP